MGGVREYMPCMAMVVVQVAFAGLNVVSKLAMDAGMSPYVLIAYRNLVAALFLAPIAFLAERRTRVPISKKVLFQIFLCSIFGATMNQLLYFVGLKYTTPTIACALGNMLPAITFILAAALKMEMVGMATRGGQAKVFGTVVCVGGSMVMTFFKGSLVRVWPSPLHWRFAEGAAIAAANQHVALFGDVLIIASCVAWAIWLIIQTKMLESFASPYTSTALMCLMAGIQCALISVAVERRLSVWALGFDIRLASVLYIGIAGSGIAFALMSWCIQVRGPLYVAMFSPLVLIIVALVGWGILQDKIYMGSAIGSILIVGGLYMVLWGKRREIKVGTNLDAENKGPDLITKNGSSIKTISLPVFATPNHDEQPQSSIN